MFEPGWERKSYNDMAFPEKIQWRHDDRGGWNMLVEIFQAKLPYELRMQNASDRFNVSLGTAREWYGKYRSMIGAK